jgi:hypothetical protein
VPSTYEEAISEWHVFKALDRLQPTGTGLDKLPAWFLRLGEPVFAKPLARLFNIHVSLANRIVPHQWKRARIRSIPKVTTPLHPSDFRPISVTPVLTRIMERLVVSQLIYPSLLMPPPSLDFSDQFAFRPSGSTTAAIITLPDHITRMLVTNPHVIVLSIDFTKAFDTVQHATLLEKMATLAIPEHAQNWLQDFLSQRPHCTDYHNEMSTHLDIRASIVQGSAIGPASYVVAAADLHAVTPGNEMCKYADDTYLIIPASNADSISCEMENVAAWSRSNNLNINLKKITEIIFYDADVTNVRNFRLRLQGELAPQSSKFSVCPSPTVCRCQCMSRLFWDRARSHCMQKKH